MRCQLLVSLLALVLTASEAFADDRSLFKYQGKTYGAKDLSESQRIELYDIEIERYNKLKDLAEQAMLKDYIAAEAKKQGKTVSEYEAQLLVGKEPTEAEVDAVLKQYQDKLPAGADPAAMRGQIKAYIRSSGVMERRKQMLAKAVKEGGGVMLLDEPIAPIVNLNIAGFPMRGARNSKVMIAEFADYQCPHCRHAGEALDEVLKGYEGKVALTFVDFPINQSGISRVVAHGAYCADQQGKFWEYHARAYADQRTLTKESPGALAKALNLDQKKFDECLASPEPEKRVQAGLAEGSRIGVAGTPSIYVNGKRLRGHEKDDIKQAIEAALKDAK